MYTNHFERICSVLDNLAFAATKKGSSFCVCLFIELKLIISLVFSPSGGNVAQEVQSE